MDDAVVLYGVNEMHCREVVGDNIVLRSILAMVGTYLNNNDVHEGTARYTKGGEVFYDLVKRERLHGVLFNSPHMNDVLAEWLKK